MLIELMNRIVEELLHSYPQTENRIHHYPSDNFPASIPQLISLLFFVYFIEPEEEVASIIATAPLRTATQWLALIAAHPSPEVA